MSRRIITVPAVLALATTGIVGLSAPAAHAEPACKANLSAKSYAGEWSGDTGHEDLSLTLTSTGGSNKVAADESSQSSNGYPEYQGSGTYAVDGRGKLRVMTTNGRTNDSSKPRISVTYTIKDVECDARGLPTELRVSSTFLGVTYTLTK